MKNGFNPKGMPMTKCSHHGLQQVLNVCGACAKQVNKELLFMKQTLGPQTLRAIEELYDEGKKYKVALEAIRSQGRCGCARGDHAEDCSVLISGNVLQGEETRILARPDPRKSGIIT